LKKPGRKRASRSDVFLLPNGIAARIEREAEKGLYIGIVPSIAGAHTQAASLDQLQINLKEVVELCFEEMTKEEIAALPEFVGLQSFSVAV